MVSGISEEIGPRGMSKIIFLNRFYYPDHSATSQLLTDLTTALAARGMRVEVITSRLRYDGTMPCLAPEETVRGVKVFRIATSAFGRGKLLGRGIDYLTFYLAVTWMLFRRVRGGDVIVAKTDPPMLSVIAAPIAWIRGARLINWLQDIFPEVAQALGLGSGGMSGAAMRLLKVARDASLRRAHLNVVLGERMAERVASRSVSIARIRVIPNWADGRLVRRHEPQDNTLRQEWGLADAFVIGYSGNLGRAHDIETFLAAIERLERTGTIVASQARACSAPNGSYDVDTGADDSLVPAIRWLFIGGGALLQSLRTEAERRGLKSLQFRPYQPRDRLGESLGVADVHLISLRPDLEGLIVPSKYYGIAAAGRPAIFIGASDGEVARLLLRSRSGMVAAEGDGTALAEAICTYARDARLTRRHGVNARRLFEEQFDFPLAVSAWEQAIKTVRS